MRLADMKPGDSGVVIQLEKSIPIRRRLQDLGLIPGTKVECIGISPLGDPAAYFFRKTVIALRKDDAGMIAVRGSGSDGESHCFCRKS